MKNQKPAPSYLFVGFNLRFCLAWLLVVAMVWQPAGFVLARAAWKEAGNAPIADDNVGFRATTTQAIGAGPFTLVDNLIARFKESVVDLAWAPVSGAAGYNIYRREGNQPPQLIKRDHRATSYSDAGLVNGVSYYYTVRWIDAAGVESGDGTEMSATPTTQAQRQAGDVPPTILSYPVTRATAGKSYTYRARALDPDRAETLRYALDSTLDGMTIDPVTGSIAWTPTVFQAGYHTVRVRARDAKGRFATQAYRLFVEVDNAPPFVDAGPNFEIQVNANPSLRGRVSDDGLPVGGALAIGWSKVSGPGNVSFDDGGLPTSKATFSAEGTYVLRLTANDSQLASQDEVTVTVVKPFASRVYTLDADFDEGSLINVEHRIPDQLQLREQAQPFNFIWVAVSTKGTVVKIDTTTGQILGEYFTSPTGQPRDPSRTTVDLNGNVWVANRAGNSVTRIGLVENGQCVDRNGNGRIDTSAAQNDLKAWPNTGGADTNGGVSTAQDECIVNYVRVSSSGTRHVSVTRDNDVWVSGTSGRSFDLIDGRTGLIKRTEKSVGYGGYGGLIDGNGVIWSSRPLLRWDTSKSLTGPNGGNWTGYNHDSYGLGIDSQGNIWNSEYGCNIWKFAPDGRLLGKFSQGACTAQGVAVGQNDDVWIAHSLNGPSTVGHLKNDGTFVGNVTVGGGPTGVAVDAAGKIWVTNYNTRTVSRIDPNAGPIGADGVTRVGAVDLTTVNLGGNPYNYSDMTGSTLVGAAQSGTWTVVFDSKLPRANWGRIDWNERLCDDGALTITVASGDNGTTFGAAQTVGRGAELTVADGRYLRITALFKRSTTGRSPILYDLSVGTDGYVPPTPVNVAPTADAGPDLFVAQPDALNLRGAACDDGLPLGKAVTAAWSKLDGPGDVVFANAGAVSTTVRFSQVGTYRLRLIADDTELTGSDDLTVTVTAPNQPPVANAGPDRTITLPNTAQLSGTATDDGLPPGSALRFAWSKVSGPGNVAFGDAGAAATTAAFSAAGSYILRLTVSDGPLSASDDIAVTVNPNPVNQPPNVNAGVDQTVRLGSNLIQNPGNEAALVNGQIPFWTQVSGNWTQATAGTGPFPFALAGNTYFHAGENALAELRQDVDVSAYSSNIATGTQRFEFKAYVRTRGESPSDTARIVLEYRNADNTATIATLDSGELKSAGDWLEMPDTRPAPQGTGFIRVRLIGTRNSGTANDGYFDAISLRAIGNAAVKLAGVATDDGLPSGTLAIAWSRLSGPGDVNFANPNVAATAASFDTPGSYQLRLTARDSALSRTDDAAVTVQAANRAPTVNAGADRAITLPTGSLTLAGSATDDNVPGGAPQVSWNVVSGPGTVTFANRTQGNTVATFSAPGSYLLKLTASDGDLLSRDEVVITLNDAAQNNQAPVVNAGPDRTVTLPETTATLNGSVTDDGLPAGSLLQIEWSQVSGPGLAQFANAGSPATTVTFPNPGVYVLRLSGDDGQLAARDEVTITVGQKNDPPVVNAGADQTIKLPANTVSLSGSVTDDGAPAGGKLTVAWSSVGGPAAVQFSNPGSALTAATFTAAGVYVLRLTAGDTDKTATDEVTITVLSATNTAPRVSAAGDIVVVLPNRSAVLNGSVTDDGLPAGTVVTVAWTKVSGPGDVLFSNPNQAVTTVALSEVGAYVLRLSAGDTEYIGSVDIMVTLRPPAPAAPVVAIAAPAESGELSAPTDIVGTVSFGDPQGGTWKLEYAPRKGDGSPTLPWIRIADGAGAVGNAALGRLDTTMLLNGGYLIRLTATDSYGQAAIATVGIVAVGNLKVGVFTLPYNDLSVPLPGIPITIVRTYDSRDKGQGDFGIGWQLSLADVRISKSSDLGKGWQQTRTNGFFPVYEIRPTKSHKVTLRFPDGKVYKFDMRIDPPAQVLLPIQYGNIEFVQLPGTSGAAGAKLEALNGNDFFVVGGLGNVELLDFGAAEQIDPTLFQLTTADKYVYLIDQDAGLRSVRDPNGNTVTIDRNGITHSAGLSVRFTRDGQGRITGITDPQGKTLKYAYDSAGNLASFTDRENNTTNYVYDAAHYLLRIIDPRGIEPLKNEYGPDGRLTKTTDGLGNSLDYTHDLANRREVIKDRLGNVTTHEYDVNGNITRTVDALGGVTSYTFDDRDNQLSVTNPLGQTTRFTYDAFDNKLTETDPLGHVIRRTYNSFQKVLTEVDPKGHTTANSYNQFGNITENRDALGNITRFSYDDRGRRTSVTDALGNVTRYEYDPYGLPQREIRADGTTILFSVSKSGDLLGTSQTRTVNGARETIETRYEYDNERRRIKITLPDGSSTRNVFNGSGKLVRTIDQLARETSYEYDNAGRVNRTVYPDGAAESIAYDVEGRKVSSTSRAGHTTRYEYDALGRLSRTIYADGSAASLAYDAAGQVVSSTDPRGNETRYEYDPAGRRAKVTDPLGKATTFTYDANGNQLSMTDANGHRTSYEYDALNRRTRTIHPDGTVTAESYDSLDRLIAKTDQAGRTTLYEYDKLSRLIKVTDALGQTTSFTYDEAGNRLTETDAANRTTSYAYDKVGSRVKRTLPGGQVESYSYNADRTLASLADFNGQVTTFAYDAMMRLLSRTPDPSLNQPAVTFTYTPTGQRATMTDANGRTNYTYDNRNRLVRKETPQGTLVYTYDATGNIVGLRSSNQHGVNVDYSYDPLSRLATVVDNNLPAEARTTSYSYDSVGNLSASAYPNGVRTGYAYNTLNRLTNLSIGKAAPIASYTYTLGAAGHRLSVTENNGRKVDYAYDALYRLTGETIAGDPVPALNGVIGYSYDPVGNRLSRVSNVAGLGSTTAAYDRNDRLTGDTYDANGNTTGSGGRSYQYDFENRLIKADPGTAREVGIVYDGDGNRVAKTVGGVTTRFLVDTNSLTGYAQVVEELVNNNVVRQYTHGADLISQRQLIGNERRVSFYHHDGQGSVRLLTDDGGSVTDTFTYDAFGTLLSRTGRTPNLYLFRGEQFDPDLGLYFLRARYLNPATGRFLTMDSFEGFGADPLSLHKYTYAHNDPVNLADPGGNFVGSISSVLGSINISGILSTIAIASLRGAIIGAVIGAVDAALGGDDILEGLVKGAGYGALFGPFAKIKTVAALLGLFGFYSGITSAIDSFSEGKSLQGIFRAGMAVLSIAGTIKSILGILRSPGTVARTPGDIARETNYPNPPPGNNGNGTIGPNPDRAAALARILDFARRLGATDIRVNQDQVNAAGVRVGRNRPDVQLTLLGRIRLYIELDPENPVGNRGPGHRDRILANDPLGIVILLGIGN